MRPDQYQEAQHRVKTLKEFYFNLGMWLVTSGILLIVNGLVSPHFWWAFFPILGWGLGVGAHYVEVFGFPGVGRNWEQRQMEAELRKLERQEKLQSWKSENKTDASRSEEVIEELKLKELRKQPAKVKHGRAWTDDDLV